MLPLAGLTAGGPTPAPAPGTPGGAGTPKEGFRDAALTPAHPQACGFSTGLAACSHRTTSAAQVKWETWRFKPSSVIRKGTRAAEFPTLSTNMCKYHDGS